MTVRTDEALLRARGLGVALGGREVVVAHLGLAQQRDHEQDLDHARRVVDAVGVGAVQAPCLIDYGK